MSTALKSADALTLRRAAEQRQPEAPVGTDLRREGAAVAVDLGDGLARIWVRPRELVVGGAHLNH
jgi:hypothetical protein